MNDIQNHRLVHQKQELTNMIKRGFEILFSATGILILLPLEYLIALVIFIDDWRSVFLKQKRIGLNQKTFTLYKFRSMTISKTSSSRNFDSSDLPRVTRIGKLLRKIKLDEHPLPIKVLKGNISFVGVRPEVVKWIEVYYVRHWANVLTVKPVITENAGIRYWNEEEILTRSTSPEIYYKEIIFQKTKYRQRTY